MSARGGRGAGCAVVAAMSLVGVAGEARAIESSTLLLDIGAFVGATHLYDMGYRGSRAVMANVEAGHVWNEQRTLRHVTTFFNGSQGAHHPQIGEFDYHATAVGHVLGGRHYGTANRIRNEGIAPDAELWSGAVASQWNNTPSQGSFQLTSESLFEGYAGPMLTGVNGRTADVINSSWGGGPTSGVNSYGLLTDSLVNQTGKLFVVSAGNDGPESNTVESPASAWNNISVGAMASDSAPVPYGTVASFSSRGPNWFQNPVTPSLIVPNVRAVVDLAAPGTNLTLAWYGGVTGSNLGGVPSGGFSTFFPHWSGTSFAAPIVAGGATLLMDVAYHRFASDPESRDGRVMKAVLQNSARKNLGWTNGQSSVGGVIQTTQSLDWATGAGVMDLEAAYGQLTGGTTNVPGTAGGVVQPIGWDYGEVAQGAPNDYFIEGVLAAGAMMRVSINWFADGSIFGYSGALDSLDNLDLQVFEEVPGGPDTLVAQSISIYNNVEHLCFELPRTGSYYIRVAWVGELFDRFGDANSESYGLAWAAEVPGPGGVVLAGLGALSVLRRRRR